MIDLKNTTFIIPVRIDSMDRIKNCMVSISYLLKNFNTRVIVKEVDDIKKFEYSVLPKIKNYVGARNMKKLDYVFEQSDDPVFYRMQIINEMLAMCTSDVVANYDADVLLSKTTIKEAVSKIVSGEADVVYPYGFPNYQIKLTLTEEEAERFIESRFDFSLLINNPRTLTGESSYAGHVQFFNRKVYVEGGMENENFKGSAPEDWERLHRFTVLGYNVTRIDHHVYHIEHFRGNNSYPNSIDGNPHYRRNVNLWSDLRSMSKDELRYYYDTQEYLKKYKEQIND